MSSLIRRGPFHGLTSLQDEMNQLFDRFFGGSPFADETSREATLWAAADVAETADEVVVTMEAPGMTADGFDISIADDVLTISGEKKQEKEETGETWHRVERRFGSFQRQIALPAAIAMDKVSADYKDGVLRVTLPKAPEAKRHQVKINVG